MDILKMLTKSADELYPADLDFFETELATGEGYSASYQLKCRNKIKKLRAWMSEGNSSVSKAKDNPEKIEKAEALIAPKGLLVNPERLAPGECGSAVISITPEKQVESDIKVLRENSSYKTLFKKYISKNDVIDEAFLEAHFSLFQQWEMDAIVSVKPLSEDFLEKYFNALSHEKIARYQLFSEEFFIMHFSQMDATIVLEQGKNEWRKKEKRSKQLDVFLRLKGIKI